MVSSAAVRQSGQCRASSAAGGSLLLWAVARLLCRLAEHREGQALLDVALAEAVNDDALVVPQEEQHHDCESQQNQQSHQGSAPQPAQPRLPLLGLGALRAGRGVFLCWGEFAQFRVRAQLGYGLEQTQEVFQPQADAAARVTLG